MVRPTPERLAIVFRITQESQKDAVNLRTASSRKKTGPTEPAASFPLTVTELLRNILRNNTKSLLIGWWRH